jgi:hypothetical protein
LSPYAIQRPVLCYLTGSSTLTPSATTNLDVLLQLAETNLSENRGR